MQETITIPTRPYIRKFILKTMRQSEPIRIEEDSMLGIGKMMMSLLVDKRQHATVNEAYTEKLTFSLPAEMQKRTPRIKYLVHINKYLEKLFLHSLLTWVHSHGVCGVPPHPACRSFVEYYRIENEYTQETAYRYWLRHKNFEYKRDRHRKNIIK